MARTKTFFFSILFTLEDIFLAIFHFAHFGPFLKASRRLFGFTRDANEKYKIKEWDKFFRFSHSKLFMMWKGAKDRVKTLVALTKQQN